MATDEILVIGLVLAWLGVPAFVSAYANRRSPLTAMLMLLLGGGCIAWAALTRPGGYVISEVPEVFFRVLGQFL